MVKKDQENTHEATKLTPAALAGGTLFLLTPQLFWLLAVALVRRMSAIRTYRTICDVSGGRRSPRGLTLSDQGGPLHVSPDQA
jgi:hypothetical protein